VVLVVIYHYHNQYFFVGAVVSNILQLLMSMYASISKRFV